MAEFLDIPALRAEDEAAFRKECAAWFEGHPEAQSVVFAVGQFFSDEAYDAVHPQGVVFPSVDPWWPHVCQYQQPPPDGSRCWSCGSSLPRFGSLDDNEGSVYAYTAFCPEDADEEEYAPVLVARRAPEGGVAIERVGHLYRPYADFPEAFEDREDAEERLPPRPEPVPKPWTREEAAMIEQIYAAPADDGPRRVLVDHWLEQGDPRGEFGALSFDRAPDGADRAWLGPLTAVVGHAGVQFGRGPFARTVTAYIDEDSREGKPEQHREWATVESLRFADGSIPLFSPRMNGLREVYGLDAEGVRALVAAGLTDVHTLGLRLHLDRPAAIAGALSGCFELKGLKTIILEDVTTHPLTDLLAALPASVERIEVWLAGDFGWKAGTARPVLDALMALKPGLEVSVGHHDGAVRRGLVATGRSGGTTVSFSQRGIARPGDRADAQAQLKHYTFGPLSLQVAEVPDAAPRPPEPLAPPAPVPVSWLREEATKTTPAGWVVIAGVLSALAALVIMKVLLSGPP